MDQWNLKMFTICNEGLKSDRLKAQIKTAVEICEEFPRYYAWCTTFDLNGIGAPEWPNEVIDKLKRDFGRGALAVKVWKEIGMQLKDSNENFTQVDDPVFDSIFNFIKAEEKTLMMHIGDPPGYWLSTGPDGYPDAWYKEGNGVWNRVGAFRGEVSYDTLMRARDRVLEKHPDLRIVGCHMGNLSFDVNQVARRLDRYPNYAVETSFTLPFLMDQAREKVREFFLKYQDRILYGSDISGGLVASPFLVDMSKINEKWTGEEILKLKTALLQQYEQDFNYFATDQEFSRGNYYVKGLALPDEVLRKIYFDNAIVWIPGVEKNF
jgi:predicted TIM-barrel fold metal-dependent hydrolase